ncbi:hypothetical protein M3C66_010065 [Micrococcus luteus]|nr:hypothetical protein [Micrococcus luteus]
MARGKHKALAQKRWEIAQQAQTVQDYEAQIAKLTKELHEARRDARAREAEHTARVAALRDQILRNTSKKVAELEADARRNEDKIAALRERGANLQSRYETLIRRVSETFLHDSGLGTSTTWEAVLILTGQTAQVSVTNTSGKHQGVNDALRSKEAGSAAIKAHNTLMERLRARYPDDVQHPINSQTVKGWMSA